MSKFWKLVVDFFLYIINLLNRKEKGKEDNKMPENKTWSKDEFLSPIRHVRYITLYCITDLKSGDVPIKDRRGNVIDKISKHSLKRLEMEGTGRLEDGKVVNVDRYSGGSWSFAVMPGSSPDGLGIRGAALKPWHSLAHHLGQLRYYDLFKRTVVMPSLYNYKTPDGITLSGEFEVHDTGGGLRKCPYKRGLWRTGASKKYCGQFDLFCGSETTYKTLLGHWDSYIDVIVMPRDLNSIYGKQEASNLLMDAGLAVDGINGPKTKKAIEALQEKAGLKRTGEWGEDLNRFVKLSLNNWK